MKNIIYTIILIVISTNILAQNEYIEEDIVDDMLDFRKITTYWTPITSTMRGSKKQVYYTRFRNFDKKFVIEIKINYMHKVRFVKDNGLLLIKLENDSLIKLHSDKSYISQRGAGAIGLVGSGTMGLHANYYIDVAKLKLLSEFNIKKIRVYFSDYYIEEDTFKKTYLGDFKKSAKAIVEQYNKKCENIKNK